MKRISRKNKLNVNRWPRLFPVTSITIISILICISSTYKPAWIYNWDTIRSAIKDSTQHLESYGSITSGIVGYSGITPQQYHRRHWLMNTATEDELMQLTTYPSGVVKATAYEALLKKSSTRKFELLTNALSDSTSFLYFESGCEGEIMILGEYLMENVLYISHKNPSKIINQKKLNVTDTQLAQIDYLYKELKSKKWIYFEKYNDPR